MCVCVTACSCCVFESMVLHLNLNRTDTLIERHCEKRTVHTHTHTRHTIMECFVSVCRINDGKVESGKSTEKKENFRENQNEMNEEKKRTKICETKPT